MAKLLAVATPIGNLSDLSPRAKEALSSCDIIAAEDTRVTMKLTQLLGVHKPMISCHRHNEDDKKQEIIDKILSEDLTCALTCDAGTPGISDPGERLIDEAWKRGVKVEPIPGPSAITTALSVSGFDTREFAFYGFLPREAKALEERLKEILKRGVSPAVIYESPHRVKELLAKISLVFPKAEVLLCRELTKKFESIYRGSVDNALSHIKDDPNSEKGEYCLVLSFEKETDETESADEADLPAELRLLKLILDGESAESAMEKLKSEGVKRNEMYKARLRLIQALEGL